MKAENKKVRLSNLEQEIIPDNPNLVKAQRIKKDKHITLPTDSKVEAYTYTGNVDPLKNAVHFMKYYRAFLSQCAKGKIKFDQYNIDSIYATQVLDLLQDHNRCNKVFLNAWLRYFCDYRLKGHKAFKTKYTSIKTFKETFEEYNGRYMEV